MLFRNSSPYLMTPDSIISLRRSFPSRVRSPTPANTENPLCFFAILFMSSLIRTVLPTPAPPNRPILPPLRYGSRRSMTFMPVKRTSCDVVRSSNFGGSRCMGSAPVLSSSSMPSMLSPVTFMTRPLICAPVGIVMGAKVLVTSRPLCRPSVLSIATVRTVSSPMCCCTSRTRVLPSFLLIVNASWIRGNSLTTSSPDMSKCTSTTGPITCEICPVNPGIFRFLLLKSARYMKKTCQPRP